MGAESAGSWNWVDFGVPFNPNHAKIPWTPPLMRNSPKDARLRGQELLAKGKGCSYQLPNITPEEQKSRAPNGSESSSTGTAPGLEHKGVPRRSSQIALMNSRLFTAGFVSFGHESFVRTGVK